MIISDLCGIYSPVSFLYTKDITGMNRSITFSFDYVCYAEHALVILPIPGVVRYVSSPKKYYSTYIEYLISETVLDIEEPEIVVISPSEDGVRKIVRSCNNISKNHESIVKVKGLIKQLSQLYPNWSLVCFELSRNTKPKRILPTILSYNPYLTKDTIPLEIIPTLSNIMDNSFLYDGLIDVKKIIQNPYNIMLDASKNTNIKVRSKSHKIIDFEDLPYKIYEKLVSEYTEFPNRVAIMPVGNISGLNGDILYRNNFNNIFAYSLTNMHFNKRIENEKLN